MHFKAAFKNILITSILVSTPCLADTGSESPWWTLALAYKADVVGVPQGGAAHGARFLDNLNILGDADLDRAMGWSGALVHLNVLHNAGGRPNDLGGTIQGVNNIEVQQSKLKLYEAWFEQSLFGDAVSVRAGLYDLNSEFYQDDASALLIAPPFGVGSELSATGPNGPSIFPSTSLGIRLRANAGNGYLEAAALNAHAGTVGDDEGVDLSGRDGALLIAEGGWKTAEGKIGLGSWRYTKKQPEIVPPGISEGDTTHHSSGVYLVAEHDLQGTAGDLRHMRGFIRLGLSEGKTTPFRGGWQAGLLADHIFAARPASSLSIGAGTGYLSRNYRDSNPADAPALRHSETIIEATYSDEVLRGFSLQPDFQYVIHPSADTTISNALILGVRFSVNWKVG